MQIKYSKQAEKFLGNRDEITFFRIKAAIHKLPDGDVIKMKGYSVPTYRLTIGKIRVLFTRDGNNIAVIKIDNRGQVYKK